MPIMNGYETTQVIRSLNDPLLHSIPIIALSANAFEEDRRMSRKSGMNAHMSKPSIRISFWNFWRKSFNPVLSRLILHLPVQ